MICSKNGGSAGTVGWEINFFTQNIAMLDWSDTLTYVHHDHHHIYTMIQSNHLYDKGWLPIADLDPIGWEKCWPLIGQFFQQSFIACKRSSLRSWKILKDKSFVRKKWFVSDKVKYNGKWMGMWIYFILMLRHGKWQWMKDSVKYQPFNVSRFRMNQAVRI